MGAGKKNSLLSASVINLPILKLCPGIPTALHFEQDHCHQEEKGRHGKAYTVDSQVPNQAVTHILRYVRTQVGDLVEFVADPRGQHHCRDEGSQEEEDCIDNSARCGILAGWTTSTAAEASWWATAASSLEWDPKIFLRSSPVVATRPFLEDITFTLTQWSR